MSGSLRLALAAGCAAIAVTAAGCGTTGGQPVVWTEGAVHGLDVTVFYQSSGCERIHRTVRESSTQVRIVLTSTRVTGTCPQFVVARTPLVVTLAAPLGGRELTGQDG